MRIVFALILTIIMFGCEFNRAWQWYEGVQVDFVELETEENSEKERSEKERSEKEIEFKKLLLVNDFIGYPEFNVNANNKGHFPLQNFICQYISEIHIPPPEFI